MLQLKELKLIEDLTGAKSYELKALKFGFSFAFIDGSVGVLASQWVAANMALLVTRVQTYLVNVDPTASDYLLYRTHPDGLAWWILGTSITDTAGNYMISSPNAPAQLALDSDEFLLFPEMAFANLIFDPAVAPPAAGTWEIRTTVFAYFVPPSVYEQFSGPIDWINVQT